MGSEPRTPPEPPRRTVRSSTPDLEWHEERAGSRPGDKVVRIATHKSFKRIGRGYLVPRAHAAQPRGLLGKALAGVKRVLIGAPISTADEAHERLPKTQALAVFSSDALSSVAYASEEIMRILVVGGMAALSFSLPISGLIVLLLAIVIFSYRQTIAAYPKGGGSYIVASDNLGTVPGLVAGSSLMIGYVLTVAVSVAAGAAALTSLVPSLLPYHVTLALVGVAILTIANLRGLREAGSIFAVPTYGFVVTMFVLIGYGILQLATGGGLRYEPPAHTFTPGNDPLTLFLLMSAFAQGCAVMTGTEAVADGVKAFKAPEAQNARTTIIWMAILLGTMFLGLTYLTVQIGVIPSHEETVVSQVGRTIFGVGPLWVLLQVATATILLLAANTAFADFPRLSFFLARDRFLPRQFQFRGDRLAFTGGILALALLAVALIVAAEGRLESLIPIYAVTVFTTFTLSQTGMVARWWRSRTPGDGAEPASGWQRNLAINAVGATATFIVTAVVVVTKFTHGVWMIPVVMPFLIVGMLGIHAHYRRLDRARRAETPLRAEEIVVRCIVPIADLSLPARQAIAYARAIARDDKHVVAIHIADDRAAVEEFQRTWAEANLGVELVVIESPFRSLTGPLFSYIEALDETDPNDTVTVVLPELVPHHWWEHLLHNHTALRLKAALLFHPGIVVVNVPYHVDPNGDPAQ